MEFEMIKDRSSIIKVIGVGGGGGNAVNHMYNKGISGVDFIICNTDQQALESSPIPNKVQLGASLTEGMGAGSMPEVGKNSAIENIEDIKAMLGGSTKMLFITAGMGGGTGTGASPIIAKTAKEMGILTVGIITTPFSFEGKRRKQQAEEGLEELKKYVDSYLVISNDKLREIYGNLTLTMAFGEADDILATAAKGIAEIITVPGYINVDFKDVRTVMNDSGVAIMGSYNAEGEERAINAVKGALASPLLKDSEIEGARYILLNISSGSQEVTMDEISVITDYIQEKAGLTADLIWGNCHEESLGEKLSVTIIATGFQTIEEKATAEQNQKRKIPLIQNAEPVSITRPLAENTQKQSPEPVKPRVEAKREESQQDLFTAPQHPSANAYSTQPVTPPQYTDEVFRYTLEDEEEQTHADESGFVVKQSDTEFIYEEKPVEEPVNEPIPSNNSNLNTAAPAESDFDEQMRRSQARVQKLKELSMKLRTSNGVYELENEPAYKRKQMQLNDVQHSSESSVSRFTLGNDENGRGDLRANNSFLHDNVD